jgi:predicted dehydrogenase
MISMIHLGVGGRGRHWLDFVADHPDFTSVACVDPDQRTLEAARALPSLETAGCFASLDEAVREVNADAVLIASPSFLHGAQVRDALDAGLAVMVEKPFSLDLGEALALVERAHTAGRPLMVAENFRFFQAERTFRRMLDDGAVGQIGAALCIDRRAQPSSTQGPWVKDLEEPFISEIAVHHFDSFRYLFDRRPVAMLAGSYHPPLSDYRGHAALDAVIEMEGDLTIQYAGTKVATRYEYGLWVEGSEGDLRTDRRRVWWRPKGRRFFRRAQPVAVPAGDEQRYPKAGTTSLLDQFRDAVTQGRVPETSGCDNLWTIAMLETCLRSVGEGRRVEVAEVFSPAMRKQLDAVVMDGQHERTPA